MTISPTRERLEAKSTCLNALGLVFLIVGRLLRQAGTGPDGRALPDDWRYLVGLVFALGSFAFWIVGISALARRKGLSKWLGVLGLASFVGWTIVKLLPNRWEESESIEAPTGDYPRPHDLR